MKIKLRHLFHPLRTTKTLYNLVQQRISRYIVEIKLQQHIKRGKRDRCWCGGKLLPFKWHKSYGVCENCGCYVNRFPPLFEELKDFYSFDNYWHTRQILKGHPSIEDRSDNDISDGRVSFWMDLIQKYASSPNNKVNNVIEVGCAHGILLSKLQAIGWKCLGVEPDSRTAAWTRENMGVDVISGFFPEIDIPECDLFLAFDVLEHSLDPKQFMEVIASKLTNNGTAIIQTPIFINDYDPPFGEMFKKVFDDIEHLFIFSYKSISELAGAVGLETHAYEKLTLAHEIVVLKKAKHAQTTSKS